ncbi:hypothetical protein SEA_REMUSLOOPIN_48 [Streptomyces phage RemusLoopin]|uniref:Uncharacterized protein n=1 Tax=Streptomyces phage RemusLoopin TaxID=2562346 RepID=A0A4D6E5D0_9CAUD|nr:hypothetical protein SEA_REMUSLOOPIN_48 [Streptomyces phage RemusLoopin]
MQPLRHKTLNTQQDHFGDTVNHKFVLPVSSLASAAVAFGLGAMIFTNGNTPADTATPQPTTTVTASPKAEDKPADVHETSTTATEAKAGQAGGKGPFKDAQGDGKYLDDFGKSVMPNGLGVHIPDALLPWQERDNTTDAGELPPGVVPAQPEGTYTDPDAGTDTSDDVVSGKPGESTGSGSTSTDSGATHEDAQPAPETVTTVPSGVVRPGGPGGVAPAGGVLPSGVVPVGPVLNSVTGVVSSVVGE